MGTTYSENAISASREVVDFDLLARAMEAFDKQIAKEREVSVPKKVMLVKAGYEERVLRTLRNFGGIATYDEVEYESCMERARVRKRVNNLIRRGVIAQRLVDDTEVLELHNADELEDWIRP